jgi:hypothetical protein
MIAFRASSATTARTASTRSSLLNEELFTSRRFDTRALAIQWAEEERKAIERE